MSLTLIPPSRRTTPPSRFDVFAARTFGLDILNGLTLFDQEYLAYPSHAKVPTTFFACKKQLKHFANARKRAFSAPLLAHSGLGRLGEREVHALHDNAGELGFGSFIGDAVELSLEDGRDP